MDPYSALCHGILCLMGERDRLRNILERSTTGALVGFKRRYRKAEGAKRADVPIAVLVPRFVLRKRLDIDQLVARHILRLSAIEACIRQLG
ncbi:DUF6441 family protein [Ralstonia solanacearum]|uniref:DUF6441 family protein n=1 Tax=Ralstonia solanacearum TaxID=305 RepID=A0AAE3NR15_RALSL|nr:DUF6441 family protein [Ralstonia solanacearum]MCL9828287.1 DUF6441 family protein [Ralstonia solanacearum]MCL9833063.1 DUF6441 family protein [Ralstonia solanacearum]MCL9837844.1 DUF6441 family protein [Ralstonia solanacearum]MDB0524931.1 DUF6441 family protein [Ralstonia solanacearum]